MFKFHAFLTLAAACVACGSSFSAREGSAGSPGLGNAGEANGGDSSAAGSTSAGDAGETNVAGSSSAGEGSTAGAAGWGNGGWGNGGWRSGSGGGGWDAECATLREEYQAAVEKARACDKDSTDQCSILSVAQPIGCGCPVLVNAKSEATAAAQKAYQAYQDNHCDYGGSVACELYCAPSTSASCAQQSVSGGDTFFCAGAAIKN